MRKLILSIVTSIMLVVSLITSTFAFIVMQNTVDVETFDFNIEGQNGMLISLDGVHFQQDISKEELAKKIFGSVEAFDNALYTGVTLKHDVNKKIVYTDHIPNFEKDHINTNNHEMVNAIANQDYLVFDIWLKAEVATSQKVDYNVKFTNQTAFSAADYTVTLQNKLSTIDKDYDSGEKITINPVNAMRLGIVNHKDSQDILNVYECDATNSSAVNLGSSAIEGGSGKYDPAKNAMMTYYNNLHPLYPFKKAADDGLEGFDLNITRYDYTTDVIDTFAYNNEVYNDIHLSICIWLEGWDADYLTSIPTSKIHVNLEFEMVA